VVNLQCNALNVRTISSYQLSTNYGVGLAVGSMGNNKTRPKVLTWEFGLDWTVVRWSVKWAKIHKNRFERSQKASPAGIGGKRIAIEGFPPPPPSVGRGRGLRRAPSSILGWLFPKPKADGKLLN
jgi:hypothetical protein